jgi:hypothetical protein
VVAAAARHIGPIHLNLSIGADQPVRHAPCPIVESAPGRTLADNSAATRLPE